MLLKEVSIILGLVICLLAPVLVVSADSTEDLLNVYGLTLGKPADTRYVEGSIEELETLLDELTESIELQQKLNDEYNIAMEQYIEKREKLIDDMLDDVSIYQKNNQKIASDINDTLLDSSIEDLLKYDAMYKTNTVYINNLLSSMNDYKLDYTYRYVSFDLTDIEQKLQQQKKLYVESLDDSFKLGEVKTIDWIMNNDRYITSKYGYRIDPIDPSVVKFHAGTDYRASVGTEVYSLFHGEVIDCGWSGTIGYYVTVQSGENVKFLICHLSEILVEKGQIVNQYDILAKTGATGSRCTGPHLHLALYLNGVTYDVDELFR